MGDIDRYKQHTTAIHTEDRTQQHQKDPHFCLRDQRSVRFKGHRVSIYFQQSGEQSCRARLALIRRSIQGLERNGVACFSVKHHHRNSLGQQWANRCPHQQLPLPSSAQDALLSIGSLLANSRGRSRNRNSRSPNHPLTKVLRRHRDQLLQLMPAHLIIWVLWFSSVHGG